MSLRPQASSSFDEIHLVHDVENPKIKLSKLDLDTTPRNSDSIPVSNLQSTRRIDPNQIYVHSYFGETVITSILSLCCLCSLPISLASIYYASRVDPLVYKGDLVRARHFARVARLLLIIGGTISISLTILLIYFVTQLIRPL